MAEVYKQKGSKNWWYKFAWRGRQIRESTKQPNKREAEQIEAAHKVSLAKAEVGIRDNKPKTLEYYRNGLKNLREFDPLAGSPLDAIIGDKIAAFIGKRRQAGLAIASINRQLEVLRRLLKLAMEWGKVEKVLPKVEMLGRGNRKLDMRKTDADAEWVFPAPTATRVHREVHAEEVAAQECACRGQRGAVHALHLPPHLTDALGRVHGPVHAGLSGRPQRLLNDAPTSIRRPTPSKPQWRSGRRFR